LLSYFYQPALGGKGSTIDPHQIACHAVEFSRSDRTSENAAEIEKTMSDRPQTQPASAPQNIIQIVPRLPPLVDGLGDYALNLAHQMWVDRHISTQFIVCDPAWQGHIIESSVDVLPTHSADALLSLLLDKDSSERTRASTLLLHYSNYGYAKRGCPFWLVDGIDRWLKTGNKRLVTMFHELYATSHKPWTSSFWLSATQKQLATRTAYLSDRCLTSRESYAQELTHLTSGYLSAVPTLPVFSGVGELQEITPIATRPPRLVVFGQAANRLRVYQKSLAALQRVCQQLEITEVWDIGTPLELNLTEIGDVPIVALGKQSAAEVGQILLHSRAGFIDYFSGSLAKSTIFAAYCAHGLVPLCTFDRSPPQDCDGLVAGKHYNLADSAPNGLNLEVAQTIADHAYKWYQTHCLAVQANVFANQLRIVD